MVNMSLIGLGQKLTNNMAWRITRKLFALYHSPQSEVHAYWWVRASSLTQFVFS